MQEDNPAPSGGRSRDSGAGDRLKPVEARSTEPEPTSLRPGSVAVMQPYFYPYAGYFRLLVAAETFVIFDDVQFARRGRVHRCEVAGADGKVRWLTLPLSSAPRDVLIRDLAFSPDAGARLAAQLARFPWLRSASGPLAPIVRSHLADLCCSPLDFIEAGLRLVSHALELPARIMRSSWLELDPALRGENKVIAAVQALGARAYVNSPGGASLYEPEAFQRAGLSLSFLTPYTGRRLSLLRPLVEEDPADIRADILATTSLAHAS